MASRRDCAASEPIGSLVGDLVRVLSGHNADRRLVDQCLEQLQDVLETLGERSAAKAVRERLTEAGNLDPRPSSGVVSH